MGHRRGRLWGRKGGGGVHVHLLEFLGHEHARPTPGGVEVDHHGLLGGPQGELQLLPRQLVHLPRAREPPRAPTRAPPRAREAPRPPPSARPRAPRPRAPRRPHPRPSRRRLGCCCGRGRCPFFLFVAAGLEEGPVVGEKSRRKMSHVVTFSHAGDKHAGRGGPRWGPRGRVRGDPEDRRDGGGRPTGRRGGKTDGEGGERDVVTFCEGDEKRAGAQRLKPHPSRPPSIL